jgi:hypothetical protein
MILLSYYICYKCYITLFTYSNKALVYGMVTDAERYNTTHCVPLNTSDATAFCADKVSVAPVAPTARLESMNEPVAVTAAAA